MIDPQSQADQALQTRLSDALGMYRRQQRGGGEPSPAEVVELEHTLQRMMAQAMGRELPATLWEEYERLYGLTTRIAGALQWLATQGPYEEDRAVAGEILLLLGRTRQRRLVDALAALLGFDLGEIRDALQGLPPEVISDFGERVDAVLGRTVVDPYKSCQCQHAFAQHSPTDGKCRAPLCFCQGFRNLGEGA